MWITCLCVASASGERGALKLGNVPATLRELSGIAGLPLRAGEISIKKLFDRGMIHKDDTGCLIIKNWDQRQFSSDNSTERARRSKDKKKVYGTFPQRSSNVPATAQNTDNRIQIKDLKEGASPPPEDPPFVSLEEQVLIEAFKPLEIPLKNLRELMEEFRDRDLRSEFRAARDFLQGPNGKKRRSIPLTLRNWLKRAEPVKAGANGTRDWIETNKEALDKWAT